MVYKRKFFEHRLCFYPVALLVSVAFLAGCSVNPVTGRPRVMLTSKSKEKKIGRKEADKVAKVMGLVEEQKIAAYVDAIGQRLVKQHADSGFDFTFSIVDIVSLSKLFCSRILV